MLASSLTLKAYRHIQNGGLSCQIVANKKCLSKWANKERERSCKAFWPKCRKWLSGLTSRPHGCSILCITQAAGKTYSPSRANWGLLLSAPRRLQKHSIVYAIFFRRCRSFLQKKYGTSNCKPEHF